MINQSITSKIQYHIDHRSSVAIVLDYDGTIVPLYKTLEQGTLGPFELHLINTLATGHSGLRVCILSGREQGFLRKQFETTNCYLFGEHSSVFYDCRSQIKKSFVDTQNFRDIIASSGIAAVFESALSELPGSYIEQKNTSIGIHYDEQKISRDSEQITSLLSRLNEISEGCGVLVSSLREVIEVRYPSSDKKNFLSCYQEVFGALPDFIAAFGDDHSDFEMFKTLRAGDLKVSVGVRCVGAEFVQSNKDVLDILSNIKV